MLSRTELENELRSNWGFHVAIMEETIGNREESILELFGTLMQNGIVGNDDLPLFLEIINRVYHGKQ